jgi:uncharacterized short protein YbdD (DUF466 family)
MTGKLQRSAIEPENPLLNASRKSNLPHVPGIRVGDRSARAAGATVYWTTRTARLMIGVPDYETYVAHRRANHPDQPIMTMWSFSANASHRGFGIGGARGGKSCRHRMIVLDGAACGEEGFAIH